MKRTPLKRKTPLDRRTSRLERRTRVRARRPEKRRSSRERDTDYMLWVKTQPCVARNQDPRYPCGGVVEADHAGRRGMGQKCTDYETIPICTDHHRQRTDFTGAFKTWNRDTMRSWLDSWIESTQSTYRRSHNAVDSTTSEVAPSASGEVLGPEEYPVTAEQRTTFRREAAT